MAARKVTFKEINKFPEVRRDLALVLDPEVAYQSIAAIARQEGKHMLKDVILFDVFEGEQLAGKKSYAIGLTFSDNNRTLTDAEVDAVMQKLMSRYEKELQAVIRK
jgi:phenylalanyl-tRNA synthetase beta chain